MTGPLPPKSQGHRGRLAAWTSGSIANRFTLAVLILTLGFVLVTGGASYLFSRHLITRGINAELHALGQLLTERFEGRIEREYEDLLALSNNTLIANALADTETGRSIYLYPLLRDFHKQDATLISVCLADFQGHPIGCREKRSRDYSDRPWVASVIDGNRMHAELDHSGGGDDLLLAYPVIYRSTGLPEGMLVAQLNLGVPFQAVAKLFEGRQVQLLLDGTSLSTNCPECVPDNGLAATITHIQPLKLPPPLSAFRLSMAVAEPTASAFAPLREATFGYVLVGLLLVPLVLWTARRNALRLTVPLRTLTTAAKRIASGGPLTAPPTTGSDDEVGHLSQSFTQMVERLRASHEQLEQRVVERTAELQQREADLAAQRREYRTILDAVPAMIWYLDGDNRVMRVNRFTETYTGRSVEEMTGLPIYTLLSHEEEGTCRDENHQIMQSGTTKHELLHKIVLPDGSRHSLQLDKMPFQDENGNVAGVIVVANDITEREQAEERMRLAATVFENTREGVLITDAGQHIIAVNRAFSAITGYAAEEVQGRNPRLLASGRHDAAFFEAMWKVIGEQDEWQGEIWNRRKDGGVFPEWLSIAAVRDETGEVCHYVSVFSDITSVKEAEHKLENLAYYDALTKLPNRALFNERLRHALTQHRRLRQPLALLFIDLDRFKVINDTLGHDAGDLLLQEVAARVAHCLRKGDTVARLGGDEFTVLLERPGTTAEISEVSKRILTALGLHFDIKGHEVFTGASIGIAVYPQDGEDATTLLKNADTAMYRAKNRGRNTHAFYRNEMSEAPLAHLQLDSELRRALAQGELELYYQPQVEMKSGRIVGAEALCRWNHPERGVLLPEEFLDTAEESGLIREIDRWALDSACAQYKAWKEADIEPLRIAVNFSGLNVQHHDLPEQVREVLKKHRLDADWLELEFTETSMMQHNDEVTSVLKALKAVGVRIAVDDFGTGYSSLGYIKRFPVDTLKIDRSFVADAPGDIHDASIVRAILSMAHSLGLRVVAEGVETEAQRDFLRAEQCAESQGFLYSHALPAEEFARLWRAQHPGKSSGGKRAS